MAIIDLVLSAAFGFFCLTMLVDQIQMIVKQSSTIDEKKKLQGKNTI